MSVQSLTRTFFITASALTIISCQLDTQSSDIETDNAAVTKNETKAKPNSEHLINPSQWPVVKTATLDPKIETRIDNILAQMSLEQKVGQIIQADSNSVTPEDVKAYHLGSVLSGGNSAPGGLQYADTQNWLDALDDYYMASIDPEGVKIAIPLIIGIDAVHGHTNLKGAVVFPHNIGLGAANNPDLVKKIAEVTATELSISGHDWTFAPTLAVPQNDRWGRAYEGFSESPEIVKSYGGVIVEGLQGRVGTDEFMAAGRVISSAKHFIADGGTENGVDQGDAIIPEKELRDLHLAGYLTAIEAGAQSVMASFSSWQGQPMHGQKELLTDVLKGRMNFKGFVVGDWNGHALISGCTPTDCPDALNAGVDMFMAPDSWKGLYESTLGHVKSGRVSMTRLDDAVRRILRVKINSGVFEKAKPSSRPLAGQSELLGSAAHKNIGRQAVRESLVLLKNNEQTLPLSPNMRVHIVGLGANNIGKMSGGWTLSWQGGNNNNDEFPNSETFLSSVKSVIEASGGTVTYDTQGDTVPENTDVVIAVYGEDPYAEFRGDRENLDFTPNDFNPERLQSYKNAGLKVVSVFLSGRPLWTNPEINDSDAFIAAWLPGSESSGLTDVIFRTQADYDFTGRLSFSWPKLATQDILNPYHDNYDPLFPLGYGLSYADNIAVPQLSEDNGLPAGTQTQKGIFFTKGELPQPWRLAINGANIPMPHAAKTISLKAYDYDSQEDAVHVKLSSGPQSVIAISSRYSHDFQRETNGAIELSFKGKWLSGDKTAHVSMGCQTSDCEAFQAITMTSDWKEYSIPLKCFSAKGVDMSTVRNAFALRTGQAQELALTEVRLTEESPNALKCDKN